MILQTEQGQFNLKQGFDLSIPVRRGENSVEAFYIPHAEMEPFRGGDFVGSVPLGGACNCENIKFNAHGNGTHTECVGHVSKEPNYLPGTLKNHFFHAQLISVVPMHNDAGDYLVHAHHIPASLPEALIIRTLPNNDNKLYKKYSGSNPIYLHPDAATKIRELGVKHLLIDQPSVDKEEDGGTLASHKNFWNYPSNPRMDATITELIYVPDEVKDGMYLLNLMTAAMESDAVPSKPMIYASVD